jgi:hypothetical protein
MVGKSRGLLLLLTAATLSISRHQIILAILRANWGNGIGSFIRVAHRLPVGEAEGAVEAEEQV